MTWVLSVDPSPSTLPEPSGTPSVSPSSSPSVSPSSATASTTGQEVFLTSEQFAVVNLTCVLIVFLLALHVVASFARKGR